jgi:hypothetical protein
LYGGGGAGVVAVLLLLLGGTAAASGLASRRRFAERGLKPVVVVADGEGWSIPEAAAAFGACGWLELEIELWLSARLPSDAPAVSKARLRNA